MKKERNIPDIKMYVRSFFYLIFNPKHIDINMNEFNIKFKPLGFKINTIKSKKNDILMFDYIYHNEVFQMQQEFNKNLKIKWEQHSIETIINLLGGYETIKNFTEYKINEKE